MVGKPEALYSLFGDGVLIVGNKLASGVLALVILFAVIGFAVLDYVTGSAVGVDERVLEVWSLLK
ncbi:hypothetical protein [Lewinella litorea]|uniref:Uncharacterized protein n=1 Tax=Neolewinella litorea TaxID=2562452 RepID=A0A4S4NMN2_9BACT|nr:hypothetical protein E4021_05770 [Neolewinella litorea]